ncbi:hypothetical protein GJW-30_1_01390 [Variibacter gotjawalensis]|uniref:Uncharacterized protein n=1 Tax=Variibacter gotjawalensis TaxID=1333996 RepID=A0A0S3PSF3_9BRAD|nr:hypothetical protein [Variibacter gotjawalensis]RZS51029.1 hypothetical protein EV661_3501 [Variibacter gotjawalensis]BAT58863.1 hypothetical protein GJW-30_1_01390 [Variibacter gotjawalensis]
MELGTPQRFRALTHLATGALMAWLISITLVSSAAYIAFFY